MFRIQITSLSAHQSAETYARSIELTNFSCLASWSTNIPTEVTYIWLLVVFGGLLPTIGMIVSNGFVLHALCMVSYC